jgi:transcriptional regulator with XRE-family HTH domain
MTLIKDAVDSLFVDTETLGLSLANVARMSGVTRVTLNNWRSGRTLPTLEKYLVVRQALDAKMEQIRSKENKLRSRSHARIKKGSDALQPAIGDAAGGADK